MMKFILAFVCLFSSDAFAVTQKGPLLNDMAQELQERRDDGLIRDIELSPMAIVSVTEFEQRASGELVNRVVSALNRVFPNQVMLCDECLTDDIQPQEGLYYRFGHIPLADVKKIYKAKSNRPRAAVWVQFTVSGLSYRIVSLRSDRVLYSANIGGETNWQARSMQNFSMSRMQQRQARKHAITHHHWNMGLYPDFTLSYNYLNQWGKRNDILSGLGVSVANPELAIGFTAYKVLETSGRPMVGGSLLINLPQAINNALSDGDDGGDSGASEDPLIIVQFQYKQPVPGNFGSLMALGTIDTTGTIAVGVAW